MRIRTRRDIAGLVFGVLCIAVVFVNGLSFLLLSAEDFWANRLVANIEVLVLTVCIGTFIGLKIQKITLLSDQLEHAARHDPLTGAGNRADFYDRMAAPDLWPCGVILADIDNFKAINDIYGHQAGDIVLQTLVLRLREEIRHTDILSRFGGEEFVIALPRSTLQTAMEVAEAMRSRTEAVPFMAAGMAIDVTASFGVCLINDPRHVDVALRHSDVALYGAKSAGRNRVRVADTQSIRLRQDRA